MSFPAVAVALLPLIIHSVDVQGTRIPVHLKTQVGQAYDIRTIDVDVRRLWQVGRFSDITVKATPGAEGTAVVFQVVEAASMRLHKILVEPSTYGLELKLPEGAQITLYEAHCIALQARRQLNAKGYLDARVDYHLVPFEGSEVDLQLTVRASKDVRLKNVQFAGDTIFERKQLELHLPAMRIRHILFWPVYGSYSSEGVETDISRLRSFYISKGYFDANVRVDDTAIINRDAHIRLLVAPGRHYAVSDSALSDVCSSLLKSRREAQRSGILDFNVKLFPDLSTEVTRGKANRIGRIDFRGNHSYSDAVVRRNFLLDEGDLLDEHVLRQSLDRLNRTQSFDPIRINDVVLRSDERAGIVDIEVHLSERKKGAWRLSGPVGTASFAGPLEAAISSRLPAWGRNVFELSTYTVSLGMVAFYHPIIPALSIATKQPLIPILSLRRMFIPANGWLSGFTIAPQLGWRYSVLNYTTTQIQQRSLPAISGDHGVDPELPVTMEREGGEAPLYCESPAPHLLWLRRGATLGIQFLGVLSAL